MTITKDENGIFRKYRSNDVLVGETKAGEYSLGEEITDSERARAVPHAEWLRQGIDPASGAMSQPNDVMYVIRGDGQRVEATCPHCERTVTPPLRLSSGDSETFGPQVFTLPTHHCPERAKKEATDAAGVML
jgi:hypothetical protein